MRRLWETFGNFAVSAFHTFLVFSGRDTLCRVRGLRDVAKGRTADINAVSERTITAMMGRGLP